MDLVLERIDAWEAAGLIDATTADRLRHAERLRVDAAAASPTGGGSAEPSTSTEASASAVAVGQTGSAPNPSGREPVNRTAIAAAAGSAFGPAPSIVEAFAYLGAAFFVGAWIAFLGRASDTTNRDAILAAGSALATAVLLGLAVALRTGDARRRRGAGVAILGATVAAGFTGEYLGQWLRLDLDPTRQLVDAAVALSVAAVGRRLLPSLSSQAALLGSLTFLGAAVLGFLDPLLGAGSALTGQPFEPQVDDPLRRVILPGAGWLLIALGLGLLGLREAWTASALRLGRFNAEPAERRAGLSRLWAGLVAVGGLASALFRSGYLGSDRYGRIVAPWVAEVGMLLLGGILLERAFRRTSAGYLVAGAVAIVIALTDVNFSYLSAASDLALVVEGAILLGVGFAADRLRRRLDRRGLIPTTETEEAPAG